MTIQIIHPSNKRVNLARLSKDQLIAELDEINSQASMHIERIESQAALWRWRILWELRKRFKSDKLFGQYLNYLREKRGLFIGTTSVVNRELHAGRFIELYKIDSLEDVGISKSTVYALSRPMHKEVAGEVLRYITKKNIPGVEVEKILREKIKPAEVIESSGASRLESTGTGKVFYLVQDNQIATDTIELEEIPDAIDPVVINDGFQALMKASLIRPETALSEQDMLIGVLDLLESYGISYMQKLVLIKHVQTALQNKMYPSK